MINLVIADDHQMMIEGLMAMLKDEENIDIVGIASNGLEVLEILEQQSAHIVLLDINMPVMDGVDTCKRIKKMHPMVKVLALTMYDEGGLITSMIKSGAKGYILKNTGKSQLLEAIHALFDGSTYFPEKIKEKLLSSMMNERSHTSFTVLPKLTRREKEIIRLIVNEKTTQEIADLLFISMKTVETHRKNLMEKLSVRNIAGLVRIAVEKGLIED